MSPKEKDHEHSATEFYALFSAVRAARPERTMNFVRINIYDLGTSSFVRAINDVSSHLVGFYHLAIEVRHSGRPALLSVARPLTPPPRSPLRRCMAASGRSARHACQGKVAFTASSHAATETTAFGSPTSFSPHC